MDEKHLWEVAGRKWQLAGYKLTQVLMTTAYEN